MKIQSFDLGLAAERTYRESYSEQITHKFSFADIMVGTMPGGATAGIPDSLGQLLVPVDYQGQEALSPTAGFRQELEKMRKIMDTLMAYLEEMTGKKCNCRTGQVADVFLSPMPREMTAWEYTQTRQFHYEEFEQTRVSAGGQVRTADNREIDFSFDFSMDRSFVRDEYITRTQSGYALVDPIIINSGMEAPKFSGTRFSFDLDMDGESEDLPMPEPGTGFLSLDLNGDGIINNGKELFGPSTDDGFGELAAYDLDQNDWIDENDPVFDRLTLWEQAESGGMALTRIKDAGIGAIFLGGVASPFDLTTGDNNLLGRVSKTSIALTEAGEVLPVQEMNYKV